MEALLQLDRMLSVEDKAALQKHSLELETLAKSIAARTAMPLVETHRNDDTGSAPNTEPATDGAQVQSPLGSSQHQDPNTPIGSQQQASSTCSIWVMTPAQLVKHLEEIEMHKDIVKTVKQNSFRGSDFTDEENVKYVEAQLKPPQMRQFRKLLSDHRTSQSK